MKTPVSALQRTPIAWVRLCLALSFTLATMFPVAQSQGRAIEEGAYTAPNAAATREGDDAPTITIVGWKVVTKPDGKKVVAVTYKFSNLTVTSKVGTIEVYMPPGQTGVQYGVVCNSSENGLEKTVEIPWGYTSDPTSVSGHF